MKWTLFIFAGLCFIATLQIAQAEEQDTEEVSGTVRVVRGSPETEIFFIDRKDSVIVPASAPEHNKILKMSMDSIKSKKPVSMIINPISHRFISLPGSKTKAADPVESAFESVQPVAKKPAASGFKEIPTGDAK